jgi:Lsr2
MVPPTPSAIVAAPATEGCTTLKVTIDSNDPLPEALRVLGAMYNVTLVVDSTISTPSTTSMAPDAVRPTNGEKSSRRTAKKAARNGRVPSGSTPKAGRAAAARGARRSAGNGTAPEPRSWARAQGYEVGKRGRMSNAVLAAYREAHPS